MNSWIICLIYILCLSGNLLADDCDGVTPCVPLPTANEHFKKCCLSKVNNKECADHCKYDVPFKEVSGLKRQKTGKRLLLARNVA